MKVCTDIHTKIKQRIEKIKSDHKLKTADFAEKIGRSEDTVNKWLYTHNRVPEIDSILEISNAFGLSADYILGQTDFTQVGNQEIHALTGLNDKAIKNLRIMHETAETEKRLVKEGKITAVNQDYIETLNFILSDCGQFERFMDYLKMYIDNSSLSGFDQQPCVFHNAETGVEICETPSALLETHAQNMIAKILLEWQQKRNRQRKK